MGKSREEVNDHFCHYLYELQRSRFPVILEAAYSIAAADPRSNYFRRRPNIIKFANEHAADSFKLEVEGDQIVCSRSHPSAAMVHQRNNRPVYCTQCNTFFGAYQTCLDFLKCPECLQSVCPLCMRKGLNEKELGDYFSHYLEVKMFSKFVGAEPSFMDFCSTDKLKPVVK